MKQNNSLQIVMGVGLSLLIIAGGYKLVTYNNTPTTIVEFAERDNDGRPFSCDKLVHHIQMHPDDKRFFNFMAIQNGMNALVYQQETGYVFQSCQSELQSANAEACRITENNDFYRYMRNANVYDNYIKYQERPKHLSTRFEYPKVDFDDRLAKYTTPYEFNPNKSLPLYLPNHSVHIKPIAIRKKSKANVTYIEVWGSDDARYYLFTGSNAKSDKLVKTLAN